MKKKLGHIVLLAMEVALLTFVVMKAIPAGTVIRKISYSGIGCLSLGVSIAILSLLLANDGHGMSRRHKSATAIVVGVLLVVGAVLLVRTFPELGRSFRVLTPEERWEGMEAVSVRFNAVGGTCSDLQRTVKFHGAYGSVMNLYPSEDERRMSLHGMRIDLEDGVFVANFDNTTMSPQFLTYFTETAIPDVCMTGKWTYVVEVLELEGAYTAWAVGQTIRTNCNVYAQLERDYVPPRIKAGEKCFLTLDSARWGRRFNMLDRAYIHLSPGQQLKGKFRVSLFAGTGVDGSNYRYVRPGATIACPLPVPMRDGYAFDGWYDGDRLITEESKVEKRESHTLKARWRKL